MVDRRIPIRVGGADKALVRPMRRRSFERSEGKPAVVESVALRLPTSSFVLIDAEGLVAVRSVETMLHPIEHTAATARYFNRDKRRIEPPGIESLRSPLPVLSATGGICLSEDRGLMDGAFDPKHQQSSRAVCDFHPKRHT